MIGKLLLTFHISLEYLSITKLIDIILIFSNEQRILRRNLRDNSNPFELDETTFIRQFRLNRRAAQFLVEAISPHLDVAERETRIPNYLRILCVLHFFGHGSYQLSIGSNATLGLSQPCVSRCIQEVSNIIVRHLANDWIHFPRDRRAYQRNAVQFFEEFHFPGIIGAIDCTHVAIIAPPVVHDVHPAAPYYNRKGFYSINVQAICDANLKILTINARYPGSVHDSAIWGMSAIFRQLRNEFMDDQNPHYHLIGDEGYPLQPWLLTPFTGHFADDTPEGRFNKQLRGARLKVERMFGVLKGRFRCLLKHRTLHYNPVRSGEIIYCCAVLHNICRHFNVPLPENDPLIEDNNEVVQNDNHNQQNNQNFLVRAVNKRNTIRNDYFNL